MSFIKKASKYSFLYCFLILMFAAFPIASFAQDQNTVVIDTSAPEDPLIAPTIVVTPVIIEPDCHTYTGCNVLLVDDYIHHKVKIHHKHRRHHICQSCYINTSCDMSPVVGQCW